MKILTLTPWYPNPENKGAGIFVKEQMSVIAKYGNHDVFVIAPFSSNKIVQINVNKVEFEKGSLTEVLVPYKIEKTIFDKFLKRKSAIKKGFAELNFKPDLFHVHEYQMVPIAKSKSLISNIPIILTEHSSTLSSNLGMKKYLARRSFKGANIVIAVSAYQRDRILSIEPHANVRIVNNFVDDIFLTANKIKRDDNLIKIISVGSLIEKKGFSLLISALASLEEKFTLTIVGDGPQKEELKALVKELKLEDRVIFTGALNKEGVVKNLSESDIFVSASKIETFGIAILEALAVGLPVVTYDNGGIRDFMKDFCGVIVDNYTSEAFAKAINFLIQNISKYNSLAIKNYIINNFSEKVFIQKIEGIYSEIMSEGK